jgi:hypothetical protein
MAWEEFIIKWALGFVVPLIANEAKQFLAPPALMLLVSEGRVLVGKMSAGVARDSLGMFVEGMAAAWGIP